MGCHLRNPQRTNRFRQLSTVHSVVWAASFSSERSRWAGYRASSSASLRHIRIKEINAFLTNLLSTSLSLEISREAHTQLRVADDYESISDDITAILKLHLRMADNGVALSQAQNEELSDLHELVLEYFGFVRGPIRVSKNQFMNNRYAKNDETNAHIRDLSPTVLDSQRSEGATIEKSYECARSDRQSRSSATATEGART